MCAMHNRYLTVRQYADELGVSVWTIHDAIRSGDLRATKAADGVRQPYLIAREDADAYTATRRAKLAEKLAALPEVAS